MTIVLGAGHGAATTVRPLALETLAREAAMVFRGTVETVDSRWAPAPGGRVIVTDVVFAVEHVLKGAPGRRERLELLGGTVGDTALVVSDLPTFRPGERHVVFVAAERRAFCPLVGVSQGAFRLLSRRDGDVVAPEDAARLARATAAVAPEPLEATAPAILRAAAFEEAIRAALR